MDLVNLLITALQSLSGLPLVAKILGVAIVAAGFGASIATSFVAFWHASVLLFSALSLVPGLGVLGKFAAFLKAEEDPVTSFVNNTLLPLLNRFSVLPLPKKSDTALVGK